MLKKIRNGRISCLLQEILVQDKMKSSRQEREEERDTKKQFQSHMTISQSQCPICLEDYDLLRVVPMMICYNQHSVCGKCLHNTYSKRTCPTCCEKLINRNDVKKNRLLSMMIEEMYRGNGEILLQTKNYTYKGETKNGKRHGIGQQITKQGNFLKGHFVDGEPIGQCQVITKNGARFAGEAKNGRLEGVFTTKYGSVISGSFDIQTLSGPNCVKKYTNGDQFRGMVSRLRANGFGKLKFNNGNTFEGNFTNDYIAGEGTATISGVFQLRIEDGNSRIKQIEEHIQIDRSEISEYGSGDQSSSYSDSRRNHDRQDYD